MGARKNDKSASNQGRGRHSRSQFEHVESLGPEAWRYIKVLILYHEVGVAFKNGARSLADVVGMLTTRNLSGTDRLMLPCSPSSITRQCKVAKHFFGALFGCSGPAPLFLDNGQGNAIQGLSDMGMRAWSMTHTYLVAAGIVPETP
ncbi:MAG TPA: hypothetical protein VGN12_16515 [Pirellulales bacterium]